ncbi:MAG: HEAT repeat domain-containing protein, partial [Anaerolineae bacterium]
EIALVEGREVEGASSTPIANRAALPEEAGSGEVSALEARATEAVLFSGRPPQGSFSEKRARLERLTKEATPAAIQELVAALTDSSETIRWQAGAALRRIGGPKVAGALRAFIAQTEDAQARAEAERVLQSLS